MAAENWTCFLQLLGTRRQAKTVNGDDPAHDDNNFLDFKSDDSTLPATAEED